MTWALCPSRSVVRHLLRFHLLLIEFRLLSVDHRVEPGVLVSLVFDRAHGAVRFDQRIEPGHHVAVPGLVLALHVAGVRVVHVVMERIVDRLVTVLVLFGVVVLLLLQAVSSGRRVLLPVAAVRGLLRRRAVIAVRRTLRERGQTEQNAQLLLRTVNRVVSTQYGDGNTREKSLAPETRRKDCADQKKKNNEKTNIVCGREFFFWGKTCKRLYFIQKTRLTAKVFMMSTLFVAVAFRPRTEVRR